MIWVMAIYTNQWTDPLLIQQRLKTAIFRRSERNSSVAQSVEQVAVNHWVGGSIPPWGAILRLAGFLGIVALVNFL